MKNPPKIRTIIVLVAFIGAYLLDKLWISKNVSFISEIIQLKFEFNAPGIKNITIPSFGLIPVLLITLFIYALTILPYKKIKDKYEWKNVKQKILNALSGIILIPFCMIVGGILFLLFEKVFPETATKVAEAFGMTTSFYFFNGKEALITLEGSVASILGFIIGLYLLSKKE